MNEYLRCAESFTNDCNDWGWTRPKPATWNSFHVSHKNCRGPSTWAIIHCFPRHLNRGTGLESKQFQFETELKYGILKSQVAEQPTSPWHWPLWRPLSRKWTSHPYFTPPRLNIPLEMDSMRRSSDGMTCCFLSLSWESDFMCSR